MSCIAAVQLHIVKNYMSEKGAFDAQTKVPLILGIWGPKVSLPKLKPLPTVYTTRTSIMVFCSQGQGKSFQCELAFKQMG